ncbi:MAG: hypothetical protein FWC70_04490 [Defluviitaleaceae bacterium]|nr:hypothetical protein [Defluviitaleaceae bacterium]
MKRFFAGSLLLTVLMLIMSATAFADVSVNDAASDDNAARAEEARNALMSNAGARGRTGLITMAATSAHDGSPFIAEFNPDEETITFYETDGSVIAVRTNQTEEMFWDALVANVSMAYGLGFNIYALDYDVAGSLNLDFRTSGIDEATGVRREYNARGEVTISEIIFEIDYESFDLITPFSSVHEQVVWSGIQTVPATSNPQLGQMVGGWHIMPRGSAVRMQVHLQTVAPQNANYTAFFTNQIGDDNRTSQPFPRGAVYFMPRWPGEPYSTRLSLSGNLTAFRAETRLWFWWPR